MRQVVVVGGRHNLVSGLVGKGYSSALATHCLGFTRIRFLAGASCVKDERVLESVNDVGLWHARPSAGDPLSENLAARSAATWSQDDPQAVQASYIQICVVESNPVSTMMSVHSQLSWRARLLP